jgi:hypothetical protein
VWIVKKMNAPGLADVIWALVVGIIQLEQRKSSRKKSQVSSETIRCGLQKTYSVQERHRKKWKEEQ